MSSNVPVLRQYSVPGILSNLVAIATPAFLAYALGLIEDSSLCILFGSCVQIVSWLTIRKTCGRHHAEGMQLVKQEKYEAAIAYFIRSYEVFTKHSWADKYRHFLGSSSKMAYREMALNNIAFCYSQSGSREKAIEYYERLAKEYPENGLAKAALNFIHTIGDSEVREADRS